MSGDEFRDLLLKRMDSQAEDIREIRRQTEVIPELMRDVAEAKDHAREAKEQATKTNGRVTTIEKWRERIEGMLSVRGELRASTHALKVAVIGGLVCGVVGGSLALFATHFAH